MSYRGIKEPCGAVPSPDYWISTVEHYWDIIDWTSRQKADWNGELRFFRIVEGWNKVRQLTWYIWFIRYSAWDSIFVTWFIIAKIKIQTRGARITTSLLTITQEKTLSTRRTLQITPTSPKHRQLKRTRSTTVRAAEPRRSKRKIEKLNKKLV